MLRNVIIVKANIMKGFITELKERNVFKYLALYVVFGWVLLQITDLLAPALNLSFWTVAHTFTLLLIGFPFALIASWNLTIEDGSIKKTNARKTSVLGKILFVSVATLSLSSALFVYEGTRLNFQAPTPAAINERSIAVLPFVNMSSDPEQDYFSDGISEEILNVLAQFPELHVISRSSSFLFREGNVHIPTVGKQLGVAHVLEGSVRKSGTLVRITAQLIDATTDVHLWSKVYDRELEDVFAIQDEIARSIAEALLITLKDEKDNQPVVMRASNIDAYNLYLLGRPHFEKRTVFDLEQAQTYFKSAIERDPNYAPAYNGMADATLLLSEGAYGSQPREPSIALALGLIQKSLQLDPFFAETHASLGFLRLMERDMLASEASLKRAIELSPNLFRAHLWLYISYDQAGRPRKAFETLQRVFSLDPLSSIVNANLAAEYWIRGRTDEAIRAATRATNIDPKSPLGFNRLGRIMWTKGQLADAAGWYRKSREIEPKDRNSQRELGALLVDWGAYEEAETLLGDQRYIVYLAQGRIEEALAITRASLAEQPNDHRKIIAAAHVEGWAGNFDQVNLLLEPLAEGADKGEGTLFQRLGYIFWDPQIAAMDLAIARLKTGNEEGGFALLSQIRTYFTYLKSEGLDNPMLRFQEARLLTLEGKNDEALVTLRQAVAEGWRFWYTDGDPALKGLQKSPELQAILSEVKIMVAQERSKFDEID